MSSFLALAASVRIAGEEEGDKEEGAMADISSTSQSLVVGARSAWKNNTVS